MEYLNAEDLGIKRWEDVEEEHFAKFMLLTGWSYGEAAQILGTDRGWLWAIVNRRPYAKLRPKLQKRLWAALIEPVACYPSYVSEVVLRSRSPDIERAIRWDSIRGGHLKTCLHCRKEFVALRRDTKYCCDEHGRKYRRKAAADAAAAADN